MVDRDLVKVNKITCMDQLFGFWAWTNFSHGFMVFVSPYDPYGAYPVSPAPMLALAPVPAPSS